MKKQLFFLCILGAFSIVHSFPISDPDLIYHTALYHIHYDRIHSPVPMPIPGQTVDNRPRRAQPGENNRRLEEANKKAKAKMLLN